MRPTTLLVLVALCAAVGLVAGKCASDSTASAVRWQQRAAAAESLAVIATARADSISAAADRVAALSAKTDTVIRQRIVRVAVVDSISPPPPDCAPNLAARDSLIDTLEEQVERLEVQVDLRVLAYREIRASHDSLYAVVRARPRPSRFHGPSIALGAFGGWCIDRPCVGIGITVNVGGIKLLR